MNKYIWFYIGAQFVGTIIVWLQVNGQLVWKSFANNMLLLALLGMPISLIFMKATQWGYEGFDQKLWPIRLIGFAVGTLTFAVMTGLILHETPDPKTAVCLLLAGVIILIQVLL